MEVALEAGRAVPAGAAGREEAWATASRAASSLVPSRTIKAASISASTCGSAGLGRQVVLSFSALV